MRIANPKSSSLFGPLVRKAAGLSSMTAVGQMTFVIALPLLARLFTPADFGLFTVYLSIVNICGPIAGMKFELRALSGAIPRARPADPGAGDLHHRIGGARRRRALGGVRRSPARSPRASFGGARALDAGGRPAGRTLVDDFRLGRALQRHFHAGYRPLSATGDDDGDASGRGFGRPFRRLADRRAFTEPYALLRLYSLAHTACVRGPGDLPSAVYSL